MNNSNSVASNIDAEAAAAILGCSYITVLNLIKQQKLKAKKHGKSWFLDAMDVQKAKKDNIITPRPRKNKIPEVKMFSSVENSGQEEVEIRLKMPRNKYQLINMALENIENKNLKQHLESSIEQLYVKIRKSFEGVSF